MVGLTSIGSVLNAVFVDGGSRDMFVRSTQDGEEREPSERSDWMYRGK